MAGQSSNPRAPSAATQRQASFGRYDFVRLAPLMGGISLLTFILSVALIAFRGFNYGIDFAGGTEMQLQFDKPVSVDQVRELSKEAGLHGSQVQTLGSNQEFLIRFELIQAATEKEVSAATTKAIAQFKSLLKEKLSLPESGVRRVDTVGPSVGSELKRNGLLAAFYSFLVILIYVAIRFDYAYAPGAVICLLHDSVFVLGIFSLLGREVNVQTMAAVLTLIGYSLNDTIVTFDRIRETAPIYRERSLSFIINKAVNDMLGRTILTAGCTFLACLGLYLFGGGVIEDIAFTLLIGIIIGTYSSVYVAAPLILVMDRLTPAAPVRVGPASSART